MTKSSTPFRKICLYCHKEFDAYTRVTKYCSHKCNQRAYKQTKRASAHNSVNDSELLKGAAIKTNLLLEEIALSVKGIENQIQLISKPYLSIEEVTQLLDISRTTIYRLSQTGKLPVFTLGGQRKYIKRSDIDSLFEKPNNPIK